MVNDLQFVGLYEKISLKDLLIFLIKEQNTKWDNANLSWTSISVFVSTDPKISPEQKHGELTTLSLNII